MRVVILCVLVVLLAASSTSAQEQVDGPFVRVEVEPETVTVGQPVLLRVTVLAPTWFPKALIWPSFEIANAIVQLPPNSSRSISERIGQETWSGVSRRYRFYPQLAGEYQITGQAIDITYADPQTRQPIELRLEVPSIVVTSVIPQGAGSLDPLLIGTSLTLDQEITGASENLEAGDAVVRSVTVQIDGMPAMFLPPLMRPLQNDGLSVMARQPVTEDLLDATSGVILGARRTESVTYVFDKGGNFTLPAIDLEWWNTEAGAIETTSLPVIVFNVAVSVDAAGMDIDKFESRAANLWVSAVIVALVALCVVVFLTRHRIRILQAERRARYLASEKCGFRALTAAVNKGSLSEIDQHLIIWLAQLGSHAGQANTWADVRELMSRPFERCYGPDEQPVTLSRAERRALLNALNTGRDRMRHFASRSDDQTLPSRLNPV